MLALVIVPGHGSTWLLDAVRVRSDLKPSPRGRYVHGLDWYADGGWNMPEDYTGHFIPVVYPWRWVLRTSDK